MATPRKKMASEGPKRSVAKPTAAQSASAKKKAAVKKSAAEGPKPSTSKPTAWQSYKAKNPNPKVVESGVGNIPATIAKVASMIIKNVASKSTPTKSTSEFMKLLDKKIAAEKAAQVGKNVKVVSPKTSTSPKVNPNTAPQKGGGNKALRDFVYEPKVTTKRVPDRTLKNSQMRKKGESK